MIVSARVSRICVVALMITHTYLLVLCAYRFSPTVDEPAHLAAGLRIWQTGQFDLYTVNPPLVKMTAAIPLLFLDLKTNRDERQYLPFPRREFLEGALLLEHNRDKPYLMFLARLACIPFSLIGAITAYCWSRRTFGNVAGLVSLSLWTFDPNLIGNGCLITPDVAGGSFALLAGYFFSRWIETPTWTGAWVSGLALGLAFISKFTTIALLPVWLGVFVWKCSRDAQSRGTRLRQFLGIVFISVYVVNVGYCFRGSFTMLGEYTLVSRSLAGEESNDYIPGNRFRDTIVGRLPLPLPESVLYGIDLQKRDFEDGRWSYLAGSRQWRGHPLFYCAAVAIKSPLAYVALLVLSVRSLLTDRRRLAICVMSVVVPGGSMFLAACCQQGFLCFVRYVLPSLPFAIVAMGASGRLIDSLAVRKCWKYAVSLALVANVGSSLICCPHYLSYSNEVCGGSRCTYMWLSDSNVDWGQDLFLVKKWIEDHPEKRPITLTWHRSYSPSAYGLDCPHTPYPMVDLDRSDKFEGWHIVSASSLSSADQRYSYLRDRSPVARIGYTVFVYYLDGPSARKASRQASTPLKKGE